MAEKEANEESRLMDSGLSSIGDLRSMISMDEAWDTTGYPSSSYSLRNSTIELMSSGTTMNFSILMSDIADVPDNQPPSPIPERHSPSIKSSHTYTGPFVLMKEYEEDTNMSYCTMNDYSATTVENMFVPYEMITHDEEEASKSESSKTEEEKEEREENCPSSDNFINRPSNTMDYSICCLSSAPNVADCGPSANVDTYSQLSNRALDPSYEIDDNRDSVNKILFEVGLSPIKSQTRKSLKQQSKGGVRRILSKLQRGIQLFQDKLAETLVPGEGDELLRMAKLNQQSFQDDYNQQTHNNEIIENIKKIYNQYKIEKRPFIEQVRLLTLLPSSWTYDQIKLNFNCSQHAIRLAHAMMNDEKHYLMNEESRITRQRADPGRVRHFISWLIDSQLLVSDSINPSSQRAVSGLDEFVTEGVAAWDTISSIHNQDLRREVAYDFENSVQHIHEWFRHNVRAAQQNHEKVKIISDMRFNEVFATFDWAQKVLPQEHREGQSSYFGKSGMSLLIGSFLWKEKSIASSNCEVSNDNLGTSNNAIFHTQSYILALTTAAQSELDTLSASEIILRQFMEDNPFMDAIYKRTDNASNFSSNSTPEAEKLICDRLGIRLIKRDYSEVQKGRDICDRISGVAKSRMRSWINSGNDLCNAMDIKEGMEYAGGVKNTRIGVAEIIPDIGKIDKTSIQNVSSIRSIEYYPNHMRIFKASGIGQGILIPYKQLEFESNMRLICPFTSAIDSEQ
ncbi:unnamed protein product, partial [Rotaria sp. Silwood2]